MSCLGLLKELKRGIPNKLLGSAYGVGIGYAGPTGKKLGLKKNHVLHLVAAFSQFCTLPS